MKKVYIIVFFILIVVTTFLIKLVSRYQKSHYITGGIENELDYTNIDKAFIELSTDLISNEVENDVIDEYELCSNKRTPRLTKYNIITAGKDINTHRWYHFKTWDSLKTNKKAWNQYLDDRTYGRKHFNFDWTEVLEQVMPLVNNEDIEYMGVIRAKNNKKTLFVYDLEGSKETMKESGSYARSVSVDIIKKYKKIPGYFLFHTHPRKVSDPFPSDADINFAMSDAFDKHYLGQIVIGAYGIIIYFLQDNRFTEIMKAGGFLAFYTFCYDLIMAWNSINSMSRIKLHDKIKLIEKFGVTMVIIPSSDYISHNYFKHYYPPILFDRFIESKYNFLDIIKDNVKFYERKEKNMPCKI